MAAELGHLVSLSLRLEAPWCKELGRQPSGRFLGAERRRTQAGLACCAPLACGLRPARVRWQSGHALRGPCGRPALSAAGWRVGALCARRASRSRAWRWRRLRLAPRTRPRSPRASASRCARAGRCAPPAPCRLARCRVASRACALCPPPSPPQSTPLAHEAAEFLTDEGPASFWAFADSWRGMCSYRRRIGLPPPSCAPPRQRTPQRPDRAAAASHHPPTRVLGRASRAHARRARPAQTTTRRWLPATRSPARSSSWSAPAVACRTPCGGCAPFVVRRARAVADVASRTPFAGASSVAGVAADEPARGAVPHAAAAGVGPKGRVLLGPRGWL